MSSTTTKKVKTDIIWYLLGSALPMITLLVRSPIYTRIYTPELYGIYSIVFISYNYISAISFQWITNNAWRYFLKYKKTNNLSQFWSVTFVLYFSAALFFIVGCSIWYFTVDDTILKRLILLGCLYVISNEFLNTLLVPSRIEGRSGFYNIINSTRALVSFLLLLVLTFVGNAEIEAFFTAPLIVNGFCITLLIIKPVSSVRFRLTKKLYNHSIRFIRYGSANLLFNIGLFLLISSDRYLIAFYDNYSKVGIYNQTYNLAQLTITALFTVLLAALNPTLISRLEKKPYTSNHVLIEGFYTACYIVLPITLLGSFFSNEIATVLLGEEFREAWNIMPVIFAGAFFAGINHFAIIKLKFINKLKVLIFASISAAALNISLNIILIPVFGFKIAAATTLIAYLYLFIYLILKAKIHLLYSIEFKTKILRLVLILVILATLHLIFQRIVFFPEYSGINAIIKTLIFIFIYYLLTKKITPLQNDSL